MNQIKDISLAPSGHEKINWVKDYMPTLSAIEKDFIKTKPFAGMKIAMSIHLEAKTAYLATVLKNGGADVYATGCNPLSTQDVVAAALSEYGVHVYAIHGDDEENYTSRLKKTLSCKPDLMIDDGGDFIALLHAEDKDLGVNLIGGCEETTTGIHRLRQRERAGTLLYPMIDVNDADCKHLFDNRYGTGQSTLDAMMHTTNLIIAGKTAVVAGYGWCGKGVAMRAKGLGAEVIVTEVDPIKAMEPVMDGFKVMKMEQAAEIGDIFVTVTGCDAVIIKDHFLKMKDGAICCNAGHFDCEVDVAGLRQISKEIKPARKNIIGYTLENGNKIYIIAEGRLVNLAAGDGHPAEIMDMSFAIQALSAKYLVDNRDSITREPGRMVNDGPLEIDQEVARRKLAYWGCEIDTLTPEQHLYLFGE